MYLRLPSVIRSHRYQAALAIMRDPARVELFELGSLNPIPRDYRNKVPLVSGPHVLTTRQTDELSKILSKPPLPPVEGVIACANNEEWRLRFYEKNGASIVECDITPMCEIIGVYLNGQSADLLDYKAEALKLDPLIVAIANNKQAALP